MEPTFNISEIIPFILIIIAAIVVYKMAKSLLKAVGFALVIGLGWFFWQGGTVDELQQKADKVKAGGVKLYFKNETISGMKSRFCTPERAEKFKCRCVITSVYNDLTTRFSEAELAKLDQNDELRLQEIRQSLKNQRKNIMDCGTEKEGKAFVDKMKWLFEQTGESIKDGFQKKE
ncbi:MAG: hypothetical protein ACPGJS_02340 [Flammeovirgaceae bacterium]